MGKLVGLCTLLSLLCWVCADVVERFEDAPGCLEFFYGEMVPDWGSSTPNAARICQRFVNRYHFATLYDTKHRIPVYSAYYFQPSNGGGREERWFVEPQLVDSSWQAEMKDGYWLGQDHPGVYLGENQALNEDYTYSGFDRGHLNPNGHHPVPSRNATFTLTNVIPQNPKLNQNSWSHYENRLKNLFQTNCSKAYVLAGAIPSADNWIIKNNVTRVNIPQLIWNTWCCLDNNGQPVLSGAGAANNTEEDFVKEMSLDEMEDYLQQFSNQTVGELFYNKCRSRRGETKFPILPPVLVHGVCVHVQEELDLDSVTDVVFKFCNSAQILVNSAIMDSLPGKMRGERFSEDETILFHDVKKLAQLICGDIKTLYKPRGVKQAWMEGAADVSSSSGISRTAEQSCSWYSDIRRWGKEKAVANRRLAAATGGDQSTSAELTPAEDIASHCKKCL